MMRTPLDIYRATIWSTLGLSPLVACGGVTSGDTARGSVGGAAGAGIGGAGAGGVPLVTGGVPATGGARFTGGAGSGGASTGGAPPQTTCLNPEPFVGRNGEPTGLVICDGPHGALHRVAQVDCFSIVPRPPPDPNECSYTIPGGGWCTQDSDCTERAYGRCEASMRGGPGGIQCGCAYGCVRDSECAAGEICLCEAAVGRCIPAGCTTDADCGGLLCITSISTSAPSAYCDTPSIACQTPTDQCTTNKDCGSSYPCVVMPGGQHACRDSGCGIGGTGRPFIVGGSARLAPARQGTGWSAGLAPRVEGLCEADRAALAGRWTELALGEHASIAANARFILELLSLGASADLVREAHQAMGDEAVHARDAFALASAYAGRPVGPGPLDMSGVLGESSPRDIVRTAIVEGCIGETVAAVEAAEALAFAEDESVRAALGRAASDEIRHAELAWKFIRWMIESSDPLLRSEVASCLAESLNSELRRPTSRVPASGRSNEVMRRHGLLDPASRAEIRRRVIVDVVEPCARALVAQGTSQIGATCFHTSAALPQ